MEKTKTTSCFSASPEIQVIEGYTAVLPCNVTFPPNRDDVALVLWFREDSGVPVYSFDARPGSFYKANHFSDDPLGSRTYFDLNYKPPILKIEHVHKDDEGEYECRVDYRRARTEKWKLFLNVIVPPKSTIIMDVNGQRLEGLAGPFDEGSSLFLKCEADGDPPPTVGWWEDSTLLDDDYVITPLGITRNEFVIEELKRDHLGHTLTCQASNTNFSSPVSSSITLDVNLKPLHVCITTRRRPLSAGRRVDLECQSRGSRPPARMTWWKDGKKMFSASAVTTSENVTISKLSFKPEIDDHGKMLTCRADNPDVINSTLEDVWNLDVTYLPKLTLLLGKNVHRDYIKEDDDVYFECDIKANPAVSITSWEFNGKRLLSNPEKGIMITNQSLALREVTRDQAGRYQCLATNVEGQGSSNEVILEIYHVPVCKKGQKLIYGVAPNESIIVRCYIEATPSNVSFKWAFNNSLEIVEITSFKSNGTYAEINYSPDAPLSYGVLYCWASNELGVQKEPCVYTVIPAGTPEGLRNCEITNKSTTYIKIKCEPGHDGGLKQAFHLEVFNTAAERLQRNITKNDNPVFVVNDLPLGTSFILALYASNFKGKSEATALTVTTLPSPGKRRARDQGVVISPLIGALIGIVLTLVFAAMITVAILGYRRYSNKKVSELADGPITNKDNTLLQKEAEEIVDTTDTRDPDVIPAIASDTHVRNEALNREAIPFHSLHNGKGRLEGHSLAITQIHGIIPAGNVMGHHEITYAELSLPKTQPLECVRRQNLPTEFAQIGIFKQKQPYMIQPEHEDEECHITAETPLMETSSFLNSKPRRSTFGERCTTSTSV
ncbi:nephrin-like [Limulus polyphemus]|uniref:Nephrin-like n=1 Tax=Limulus polyphemus TaxID=6850 RepID=A0ABM1S9B2_LIMPO|nr:nephrin-like [Limulus polyphemus]